MPDIQAILSQMTLEEKAALCTGATPWTTTPIERLGVPEITVADGPHGVRRPVDPNSLASQSVPATCFPTASCLAATWDVALLRAMGQALGKECKAIGVDVLLGPGVNMKRSPLGGRNFEYYSEDPFLAGEMATALISGVQSEGIGTSLKHFAANNQEYQRLMIDTIVDERTLREIYLPAFEVAVKKARPWTVMCAYNKINGNYCSEHHKLLVDILKKEWGFEGFVVSDWGAVHDRVASLEGGLDLEMPGSKQRRVEAVIQAVRSGELDEAVLDEAVRRILSVIFKAAETPKNGTFGVDEHHTLAQEIASEGIVLLKNNGLLPLKNPQQIAVIGRAAQKPHFQGGGSSHINPTRLSVPFVELQKQAGGAEVAYAEGYPEDETFRQDLIDEALSLAESAEVALLFLSLPESKESEGYDRPDLDLTEQQVALIKTVSAVQPNTVVVLNTGSPVAMTEWIDGVAAVIEAWMMGQAGGAAVAQVLFGEVNPSGKVAETFPLKIEDTPAYLNWPGDHHEVHYGEGLYTGYRYYDARRVPVLFPFGYGLSYTTFEYNNSRTSARSFNDMDGLTVSVDVTNTGRVTGKEIVQIYVHDHKARLSRPEKELKGFAKVELQPGETRTVTIPLDFRAFAYYHPAYEQWITDDGDFDILIGASSADIRCRETVTLHSTLHLPSILNEESTVREWLDDPRGKVVFEPIRQMMVAQMEQAFTGSEEHSEAAGIDMMDMLLDMPLRSILDFGGDALPMAPEEIIGVLLEQLHEQAD